MENLQYTNEREPVSTEQKEDSKNKYGIEVVLSPEELNSIVTLLGQLPTESEAWPLYDYLRMHLN